MGLVDISTKKKTLVSLEYWMRDKLKTSMNKTILSDIEFAKKIYPIVVHEFEKFINKNYDDSIFSIIDCDSVYLSDFFSQNEYLLKKLNKITGKDINIIDDYINDYFKHEGLYNLSFRISLPEPKIIENVTEEEIFVIYKIVKSENYKNYANDYFERRFYKQFNVYFQDLLEINLKYLLDNSHSIGVW